MSVNNNVQNLVTYVDFKLNKVTLMLNFGISCKTAKIEEYTFDESIENFDAFEDVFVNLLKTFVTTNACEKADCYFVLPSNLISFEYIKIPNLGLLSSVKPKVLLQNELGKILKNEKDFYIENDLVLRTKKNLLYKCCITKKSVVDKFVSLFKKCGLNLKNVSFDASAFLNSVMALTKIKQTSFICLNVKQNSTQVIYSHKGQLMSFCNMPFGTDDLEKQKIVGTFMNNDYSVSEVYLVNEATKNNVNSALFDEEELVKQQHKSWQDMQKSIDNLWLDEFTPLLKAVMMINETVQNYEMPVADAVYVNIEEKYAKKFREVLKSKKNVLNIKFLEDEFITPCGLKDFLHLYGMIYAFKFQRGNNIIDKETKQSLFS